MLGAICGSARSMDRAAQSGDPYFAQGSCLPGRRVGPVLHTIPMPTVCDSVSWNVEVGKGYQSVHIYVGANEGVLY